MLTTARVWNLPGYKRRPTLSHLAHIRDKDARWGWFYASEQLNYKPAPLAADPFGRLWARGDAVSYRISGEHQRPETPLTLVLLWWRLPEQGNNLKERSLAMYLPDGPLDFLGQLEAEPFCYYQVKEVLTAEQVPAHMRLEA